MKALLGSFLGETLDSAYNPHKYSLHQPGGSSRAPSHASVPTQQLREAPPATGVSSVAGPSRRTVPPPAYLPPLSEQQQQPVTVPEPAPVTSSSSRLYGSSGDNHASAQPEPSSLGCWLVSQPGVAWPVRQELKADTVPLQARVQIAASTPPLRNGSVAAYEVETFMSPLAASQPVVSTGTLINTYTGEVVDLYEDAMPPPDNGRDAGDAVRERRQAQRRLLAAEGNVNASHRKREQQDPIQPGDAGVITQVANFQVSADVATEWNERANRDLYFNRNELAPTELEMTRNPFGFEGYNNRLRVNPYLLPTNDLDDKNWMANATLLPGGDHRPKNLKPKLKKERSRMEYYVGQVSPDLPQEARPDNVRRSAAARDVEGATRRGNVYGDAPPVASSAAADASTKLLRGIQSSATPPAASYLQQSEASGLVTAASVMQSLGLRGLFEREGGGGGAVSPQTGARPMAAQEADVPSKQELLRTSLGAAAAPFLAQDLSQSHGQDLRVGARAELQQQSPPAATTASFQGSSLLPAQGQHLSASDALELRSHALLASAAPVASGGMALQTQSLKDDAGWDGGPSVRPAQSSLRGATVASAQVSVGRAPEQPNLRAGARELEDGLQAASAAATAEARRARKQALEDLGQHAPESSAAASGAHGSLGEVAPSKRRAELLEDRAAAAFADRGFLERNSRVSTSNARGSVLAERMDNFKVGGQTDYQRKALRPERQERRELQTHPYLSSSVAKEGQRTFLSGAREARPQRVAKSPFKAHRLRERSGISARLQEPMESRFETDAEEEEA